MRKMLAVTTAALVAATVLAVSGCGEGTESPWAHAPDDVIRDEVQREVIEPCRAAAGLPDPPYASAEIAELMDSINLQIDRIAYWTAIEAKRWRNMERGNFLFARRLECVRRIEFARLKAGEPK